MTLDPLPSDTYEGAMERRLDAAASALGADLGAPAEIVDVVAEVLVFLRNNPANVEEEGDVTMILGWDCRHEAQILIGRLADRGIHIGSPLVPHG